MKILALDPSMSLTGYVVLDGPRSIVEAGVLRGKRGASKMPIIQRCHTVWQDVCQVLGEQHPSAVVLETPQTSRWKSNPHGGSELIHYGVLVGYLAGAFADCHTFPLYGVSVTDWTRKCPKGDAYKSARVETVKRLFPNVELGARSVAGNVADAILMGIWWLERNGA